MKITLTDTDDPGFIEAINAVLGNILAGAKSDQVWIIGIDNWFDHKWLQFSGYGAVATVIPLDSWDTGKKEFYRDKLTFPPFSPNRVVSQCSYARSGNGYAEVALPRLPHSTERQHSEKNLNRRVQAFSGSAIILWYSGNTVANGRGSLMVYDLSDEHAKCWFVAFVREGCTWRLGATKGIPRDEVETLLEPSQ